MEWLKSKIGEMEYGSKEKALYEYLLGQQSDPYFYPMYEEMAFEEEMMPVPMAMEMDFDMGP